MTLDLDTLKRIAQAATPPPWIAVQLPARGVGPWRVDAPGIDWIIGEVGEVGTDPCDAGNAVFIAAARDAVPQLIAEIERLRYLLGRKSAPTTRHVQCEGAQCLASIDHILIASSAWVVVDPGCWLCPDHARKETP